MNSFRVRPLAIAFLLVFAISCNRDDDPSPFLVNGSVKSVDFLTEKSYTTLNIEVAYAPGSQPTAAAISNLAAFLSARLNKSAGINITQHLLSSPGKTTIDLDEIRAIEQAQRKMNTSGTTLTAWIMFLDTEYSESTDTQKVLGLTYGASSIAVFEKSIDAYVRQDMPSRAILETVVLDHEFGHVFGLVDNGTIMKTPHKDDSHGAHCSNTECLMYWKTENNVDLGDVLGGQDSYPTLDANCLADLKAAGGK